MLGLRKFPRTSACLAASHEHPCAVDIMGIHEELRIDETHEELCAADTLGSRVRLLIRENRQLLWAACAGASAGAQRH